MGPLHHYRWGPCAITDRALHHYRWGRSPLQMGPLTITEGLSPYHSVHNLGDNLVAVEIHFRVTRVIYPDITLHPVSNTHTHTHTPHHTHTHIQHVATFSKIDDNM